MSLLSDILKNLILKKSIHYVGDKLWSMNASKIVGAGGGACTMNVFWRNPVPSIIFF